nr:hypothetical protein [uncultured Massilia sp.]
MRYFPAALAAFLAVSIPLPTVASGDGDLWVGPAAMACLASQPELSSTPLGRQMTASPQFMAEVQALKSSGCLTPERKPPAALCKELLGFDPTSNPDLAPLYQRYGGDIMKLGDVFACKDSRGAADAKR